MRSVSTLLAAAALALASCWGCAQGVAKGPVTTIPVKGKVTYKGKPLTRGTVMFEPDGMGREAFGEIKPDGTFELTTYQPGDGAVPGHHRVAVSGGRQERAALPLKFQSYASSKLEADVTADNTDHVLELR